LHTGEAEVMEGCHPYRSRVIVRRPVLAADFKSTLIIEFLNVTGGTDKDINWSYSFHHRVRNDDAFIAVTAQQAGISSLSDWSPERYGALDATHDGMVQRDALSYDIFSVGAKAVIPRDQRPGAG